MKRFNELCWSGLLFFMMLSAALFCLALVLKMFGNVS